MWSTRKELETALAQAGLGEWSPRLAAAARHAMVLEPGPFEEGADAPIGASRLGGMPDLPADVPWPWRPALPVAYFKEHGERPWPVSFIAPDRLCRNPCRRRAGRVSAIGPAAFLLRPAPGGGTVGGGPDLRGRDVLP